MKVLGYFTDGKTINLQSVFIAIDDNERRLTIYSPTEQHSEGDRDYVKECRKITKEEYLNVSKNFYTPSDYLV
jgi:hypothetical protein